MTSAQPGRIPHRANPYSAGASSVRPYEEPEPAVLTLRDLDRLVAARLSDARAEWAKETRRQCAEAWERGREHGMGEGYEAATSYAREAIRRVVGGRLIHIERHLRDRRNQEKRTIVIERDFMNRQADELHLAVAELEDVGS